MAEGGEVPPVVLSDKEDDGGPPPGHETEQDEDLGTSVDKPPVGPAGQLDLSSPAREEEAIVSPPSISREGGGLDGSFSPLRSGVGGARRKAPFVTERRGRSGEDVDALATGLSKLTLATPPLSERGRISTLYRLVYELGNTQRIAATEMKAVVEENKEARKRILALQGQVDAYSEELDALRGASTENPQEERDPTCDSILVRLSANPIPKSDWPALNPQLAQYLQRVGTWPMSPSGSGAGSARGSGRRLPAVPPRTAARRLSPRDVGASPSLPAAAGSKPSPQGAQQEDGEADGAEEEEAVGKRRVSFRPPHLTTPPVSGATAQQGLPEQASPSSASERLAALERRLEDVLGEVKSLGRESGVTTSTPAAVAAPRPSTAFRGTSIVTSPQGFEEYYRASAGGTAPHIGEKTMPLPPHTRLAPGTAGGELVVASDVSGPNLVGVHIDDRSVYPISDMDPLGYYVGRRHGSPISQGYGRADDPRMTAQLDLTYSLSAGHGFGRPEERYQGVLSADFGGNEKDQRLRQLSKLVKLDFPQMNNAEEAYLWSQWLTKFIGLARALQFSYEEMGYTLALYLSQCVKAAQAVSTLPSVLAADYNTLVTLGSNLFCPNGRAAAAQAKLNARVQSGESIYQFAANLLKLVEAAFPCSRVAYTSERRQEAALRRFCEGLNDRTLAVRIMDRRCTTIQQALAIADEYTVTMRAPGVTTTVLAVRTADLAEVDSSSEGDSPMLAIESSDVLAVTRKDSQVRSNGPAVPQGKSKSTRNRNRKKGPAQSQAQGPPSSGGNPSKTPTAAGKPSAPGAQNPRGCWSCGRPGHLMRECTLRSGRRICFVTCDEHNETELPEDF